MVKEIPVVYLQAASCTGCAVSSLNTASPTIKNVLIDQIAPGVHINLRFHPVIMAAAGEMAIQVMEDTAKQKKGGYVFVVDGAVPMGANGVYGTVGERNGKPVSMLQRPGTPWPLLRWAPVPRSAVFRRLNLIPLTASR